MKGQFCDYLPARFYQEASGCSGCQIYLDRKNNQEKS